MTGQLTDGPSASSDDKKLAVFINAMQKTLLTRIKYPQLLKVLCMKYIIRPPNSIAKPFLVNPFS